MKTISKSKSKIEEKRSYLKELSKPIKSLVKEGMFGSVNEGLKEMYQENGHTTLKTLQQWNKKGMRVKKGETALLLWGSPRKFEVVNADTSEVDEMDFYPICFVFSQKQVQKGGQA
ncbi:MAG: hypothetical protein PHV91_08215 [Bacteroidales bacterium]|jgi:hypothetical protein|nr:hypothetical protein [Bacteroidales bacterium]